MSANPIQLQKYLDGVDHPAGKRTPIDTARRNSADDTVVQTLEDLPMEEFNSPNDVSKAIRKR